MDVPDGIGGACARPPANFGSRFETWLEQLAPSTLAAAPLVGLAAAGTAYRLVRAATLARMVSRVWSARAAAGLAGLSAESAIFPLATRLVSSAHGEGRKPGSLISELGSSFLALGSLRFAALLGNLGKGVVFRQAALLGGVILGRRLEIAAGFRTSEENSFTASLAMLFQVNAAASFSRALLGPKFRAWEAGWELRTSARGRPKIELGFTRRRVGAGALSFTLSPPTRASAPQKPFLAAMRWDGVPGSPGQDLLYRKFRPRFPADGPEIYSEHVLRTALSISFPSETYPGRFLEGLAQSTQAGTFRQASFVEGVKRIFQLNPLRSATGSFEEALQQNLLENLLAENFAVRRGLQWDALLPDFETGMPRAKTTRWLRKFGWDAPLGMSTDMEYLPQFLKPHEKFLQGEMQSYSGLHRILILNFIHRHEPNDPARARKMMAVFAEARRSAHYPAEAVDRVLEYARTSPFGHLAVRRLFHVLTAGDVAAKLWEIPDDPDTGETSALIRNWQALGRSAERMARDLAGTRHTAYLDDPRLARKVLSVYLDINRFPQAAASSRRRWIQLDQAIFNFVTSGRRPDASDLIELLETNLNPEMRSLARSWEEGRFRIEFLPDAVFDGLVSRWGQAKAGHAVFMEPDRILLRAWSPAFLRGGDTEADFQEIMERLKALVHEWEHWRHGGGRFEGVEKGGSPVELANPGRRERLVSEMMAHFEQYRWSFKNFDDDFGAVSSRLGQTPAMFFRGLADEAYFGAANREAAAAWLKLD